MILHRNHCIGPKNKNQAASVELYDYLGYTLIQSMIEYKVTEAVVLNMPTWAGWKKKFDWTLMKKNYAINRLL